MSDVRRPVGLTMKKCLLYVPGSSLDPGGCSFLQPARIRSSSARSSSVKNSLPAYFAGLWTAVWYRTSQMPERSGAPHAVLSDGGACDDAGRQRAITASASASPTTTAACANIRCLTGYLLVDCASTVSIDRIAS